MEAKTPSRAMWSGAINFGLVSIPVKAYKGEEDDSSGFRLLCTCHYEPITRKYRCASNEAALDSTEMVKGVSVGPEKFVIIKEEELDTLPLHTLKTIEIEAFVSPKEIPILTHAKGTYFLAPDKKEAEEAYAVLRKAMERTKLWAIARMGFREKEILSVLSIEGNCILLTVLNWPSLIRSYRQLPLPEEIKEKAKIDMAVQLLKNMQAGWTPEQYKDQYALALAALVDRKIKGQKVETIVKSKTVVDLQKALRASVELMQKKSVKAKQKIAV